MKSLKLFIVIFLISYLLGSFYSVSFNVAFWDMYTKIWVIFGAVFLWFCAMLIMLPAPKPITDKQNEI